MTNEEIAAIVSEWAKGKKWILRIFLFGSRAKNPSKQTGDIDLAIEVKTDNGGLPDAWAFEDDRLKSELHALLKVKIDFVQYNTQKDWIGYNVLIYEKMDNK